MAYAETGDPGQLFHVERRVGIVLLNIQSHRVQLALCRACHVLGFLTPAYQPEYLVYCSERAVTVAREIVVSAVQHGGEQIAHGVVAGKVDEK